MLGFRRRAFRCSSNNLYGAHGRDWAQSGRHEHASWYVFHTRIQLFGPQGGKYGAGRPRVQDEGRLAGPPFEHRLPSTRLRLTPGRGCTANG